MFEKALVRSVEVALREKERTVRAFRVDKERGDRQLGEARIASEWVRQGVAQSSQRICLGSNPFTLVWRI